ncbi:MAG TPA: ATP-binding cassette domain-containing protein, partial [Tabrizicola sp.]
MPLIEIENLSVTFRSKGREVRAVQDVSLSVEKGESFGLVGESGSGKSTILRAICGMAPVSAGTIR